MTKGEFRDLLRVLSAWEDIGELARDLLGVPVFAVDSDGDFIAGAKGLHPYCQEIHRERIGLERCRECYHAECFTPQAVEAGFTQFHCPGGLTVLAFPLGDGSGADASIVLGGVLLGAADRETYRRLTVALGLSPEILAKTAKSLPRASADQLGSAAQAIRARVGELGQHLGRYTRLTTRVEVLTKAVEGRMLTEPETDVSGLPGRSAFLDRAEEECQRAERYGEPLSVICLLIGGIGEGDDASAVAERERLLLHVANALQANTRRVEPVSRIGDSEFGVLVPRARRSQACHLADRLQALADETLQSAAGSEMAGVYQVRAGVASHTTGRATPAQLMDQALAAAHEALEDANNLVRVYASRVPSERAGALPRVVITGVGMITPYGIGKDVFWDGAVRGESSIRCLPDMEAEKLPTFIGGVVPDFDPEAFLNKKRVKRTGRSAHLAMGASRLAVEDAGLDLSAEDADRVAVVTGTAVGGIEFAEDQHRRFIESGPDRVSPFLSVVLFAGAISSEVSMELGVHGPTITVSTGCSAGSDSVGYGLRAIQEGRADVVVAGGVEAPMRPIIMASFSAINALSSRNDEPEKASRPFDRERDGFVMSEAGVMLVLEELQHALKRDARIYGELLGYAATGDAFHMTRPAPDGAEATRCIEMALEDAHIAPEGIDHINAHGSSTPINDRTETMIMKNVFKDRAYHIPVVSTKSLVGHPIGASGAMELCSCLFALQDDVIHPTINYEYPDPDCDLDYCPNEPREAHLTTCLSNSFGFGGKNAALVVGRFQR